MSFSSRRSSFRTRLAEGNENEHGNPADPVPLHPPRSPLISIQELSQNPREGPPSEPRLADFPVKGFGATPKSAPSTPARGLSKVFNGIGSSGANNSGHQLVGRERGCSSRASKGIHDVKSLVPVDVPYFELNEDPSFWKDHNVQVLIRIRPVSGAESALQSHKRCLVQESSQTLVWTGHPETRFTFDHVACEAISQEKLFKVVGMPMVENCMSGYNSCMFAYGQTGSGKTYTMMGEMREMDNILCEDRGMTPRIFEYLFARIREEEDSRSGEQLKYSCKCSFLEIYNEQITDLLEPSSTNLQLREDLKKGVYVENLKEFEVSSVKDVLELLLQGAANRKMAATHMNSESSRSHSVFTCVIESQREKDSMTHLRFGRLNLVDLAGSERQKSSGAEGERLKEAANINRSLSTLGLVIMTLVDIANGKSRHVPYRDSRLTFLLQDSLGGNSKTTIIANVSPSICSSSETLSTLKFAQRAKLIQNNAKVNEDASGDVMALQRQIQTLKDQLNFLMTHQSVPRSLYYPFPSLERGDSSDLFEDLNPLEGGNPNSSSDQGHLSQKVKELETALTGALRREKMIDAEVRRLEAENKHMNRLVHQREDDAQRTKVTLRLRDEKLRRLELLADDLVTSDGYLMEENVALSKEIQLLREKIDSNPDLTQFALENMRLVEQLRMFQNFYQQGERELLLAEVSHLRNQLLKVLDGKFTPVTRGANQGDDATKELASCKRQLDACLEYNSRLAREIHSLRCQLKQYLDSEQTALIPVRDVSRVNQRNKETDKQAPALAKGESEEIASYNHAEKFPHISQAEGMWDVTSQFGDVEKELMDARALIKAMESRQVQLIAQLDNLKQENNSFMELLQSKVHDETHLTEHIGYGIQLSEKLGVAFKASHADVVQGTECGDTQKLALVATLEKMVKDLKEAKNLNKRLKDEHVSTWKHEMEQVQEEVEVETANTILHLQEQVAALQQEVVSRNRDVLSSAANSELLRTRNEELNNQLCFLIQENVKLSNLVAARDMEIRVFSDEWEKAVIDLTHFLLDGCKSLEDATQYIESIVNSFPQGNEWINQHVERAIKISVEKEKLIADLQKRVDDAQQIELEMRSKLDSLRGATLAITEVQQIENDENSKELIHLTKLLDEQALKVEELENVVKCKENHIVEAKKRADAAFLVIKKFCDMNASESFDVEIIKSAINRLLDESSLVENINQAEDPAESEIHILSMDVQGDNIKPKIPNGKLPLSVENPRVDAQEANAEENSYALEELRDQVEMAIQRIVDSNDFLHTSYTDTEKHIATVISDINNTYSDIKMLFHDSINDVREINNRIRELKIQRTTAPSIMVEYPRFGTHAYIKSTAMEIIVDGLVKINKFLSGIKSGFNSLFNVSGTSSIHKHEEKLIPNNLLIQSLMKDVELAVNALVEMRFQLGLFFHENDVSDCFAQGNRSNVPAHVEADNKILDVIPQNPSDQIAILELSHMLQTLEERIEEVDADCCRTKGFQQKISLTSDHAWQDTEKETTKATGFLLEFEKTQETMKEAELVLQALLKANEDTKCERDRWKQASQELLAERTTMVEELHRLEALNFSVDNQNQILEEQIQSSIAEISGIATSLRESLLEIQRITLEEVNVICSDMFSFGQELLRWIGTSKSWLEESISEIMEKGFALLVLYQCQVGAFSEQNRHVIVDSSLQCRQLGSYSALGNAENNHKYVPIDNLVTQVVTDVVVQNDFKLNCFSLRNNKGGQNELQTVEDLVVGPIGGMDAVGNETTGLSSDQKSTEDRVAKLQKNYWDLTHDTELVKDTIAKMAACLDNFIQELTLCRELPTRANFPVSKGQTELVTVASETVPIDTMVSSGPSCSDICKDFGLQPNIFQDDEVGILKSENDNHVDRISAAQTDAEVLLVDIGHLKHQCAQMISSQLDSRDNGELSLCQKNNVQESSVNKHNVKPAYGEKEETIRFHNFHAKTEFGNQLMQTLNEIRNNLCYIVGLFHPRLLFHTVNGSTGSLLGKMFQNICSIEEKMHMLLHRGSSEMKEADVITDSSQLKSEFAWKDNIIRGLLFDLRLLQESTSNVKDIKDETREMVTTLSNVQHKLAIKTAQVDNILSRQRVLEAQLAESEDALSRSKSQLEQAQELCVKLTNENTELRLLLEDEHIRNTQTEEFLEEKRKVIDGLERQILSNKSSVEEILDDFKRISNERNHLQEEIVYLNDKLDMAMALVDEKEAIAVEARQVAESSKLYAEEKEEEVKILERCIQELEDTINVLERKVYDMKEAVENHQLIRKNLEQEIQVLTCRMHMVENAAESLVAEDLSLGEGSSEIPRRLDNRIIELCEARNHIEDLEMEILYKEKEIKQYREHISELILHSEAQSSQYQEKFKALEDMFTEVKVNASTSDPSESHAIKVERNSIRTRGSGSPFRCISSLVQQMNLEKDQELSVARHQIEELEALAANRQKEICMLTARLAAVDSMTHDVIRDLLGVKLDMTNYANLIDQEELQKLLMTAQQQVDDTKSKDMEILNMKKQINYLIEERDSLAEEISRRKSDILGSQVLIEQLQRRDQLLTAQNEMLKMDKANLHRKIAKMDETVKSLVGSQSVQDHLKQPIKTKGSQNAGSEELGNRLAESDKFLSHARNELARYHKSNSRMPFHQHQ